MQRTVLLSIDICGGADPYWRLPHNAGPNLAAWATSRSGRRLRGERMQMALTQCSVPPGISVESVRQQIERILRSRAFAPSVRLSTLLRFIVERVLQDPPADLNELQIAREVFAKPDSFDPRVDPIVRVHASRVRTKLRMYYATQGADDPILVELPPRCYLPVISRRSIGAAFSPPRKEIGRASCRERV